jgi:hypothetical protein
MMQETQELVISNRRELNKTGKIINSRKNIKNA